MNTRKDKQEMSEYDEWNSEYVCRYPKSEKVYHSCCFIDWKDLPCHWICSIPGLYSSEEMNVLCSDIPCLNQIFCMNTLGQNSNMILRTLSVYCYPCWCCCFGTICCYECLTHTAIILIILIFTIFNSYCCDVGKLLNSNLKLE